MDINLFREEKGGNPELVRESQRRRHKDVSVVDKVIELDEVWRKRRYDRDQINKEFNKLNKEKKHLSSTQAKSSRPSVPQGPNRTPSTTTWTW